MKVPGSIRAIYETRQPIYAHLKERADDAFRELKKPRWHYESRVKASESFALKIETGRVDDPPNLEDFFACTLVVENVLAIAEAESLIVRRFPEKIVRRPASDAKTSKNAECFPFDDLRLYPKWSSGASRPDGEIEGLQFEVQIKTFLQHAWGIATHDLVYKSNEISWAKRRIAYQIKAMLEHAEISIAEAQALSSSVLLKKVDNRTAELQEISKFLYEKFDSNKLPTDTNRLAGTIADLLKALALTLADLRKALQQETSAGRGVKIINLSPYGILVQSIGNIFPEKILSFKKSKSKFRLLIPSELAFEKTEIKDLTERIMLL